MDFIKHRCNRSADLESGVFSGVEIDLRSSTREKGYIHLSHDPWLEGEGFEEWLKTYSKLDLEGPLILNTKEDGLEDAIEELLLKFKIENYFFLDTTLPTMVKNSIYKGNTRFAVRCSEFEPLNFVMSFAGKCEWVWVDCFKAVPPSKELLLALCDKFKICIVSPELQGADLSAEWDRFEFILSLGVDAVCTKNPSFWSEKLSS